MQEKVSSRFNAHQDELVFYTYLVGSIFVGIVTVVTGELSDGIMVTVDEPYMVFMCVCMWSPGSCLMASWSLSTSRTWYHRS